MKKITYICTFLLTTVFFFSACQDEDLEFGAILPPSDVQITAELVGQDSSNPNGDGSGQVIFTATANNALNFKFVYKDTKKSSLSGTASFSFTGDRGVVGQSDLYSFTVMAIAYGTAGVSASKTITVDVLAPNVPPPTIIEDFEGTSPTFGWFGGVDVVSIVDNPDTEGNTSSKVGTCTKFSGSETWAGMVFENDHINLLSYSKVALKVWSPKAGIPVILKLEHPTVNTLAYEATTNTTTSNAWEEIVFDFSGADTSIDYKKVVLFFDFGTSGDNSVYYCDDLKLLN